MKVVASLMTVLALLPAAPVAAQTVAVSGTVVDQAGAGVAGAVVTLSGGSLRQTVATEAAGLYRFSTVPSGTYGISVLLVGFKPAARDQVVVGTADVTVPAIALEVAGVEDAVVVSASRLESTLLEAPATMSVVPGAAIQASAAQNYGDVLRSVPGLNVIQMSARDINLTSRQATSTLATSQLALVDGRSVYLDFFGLVLWDLLPASFDDVKQIEVVRGPASAVWGANALSGVVNVITRSPRETPGRTSVVFHAGSLNRNAGSTAGRGAGALYGVNFTTSQAPTSRWSYRLSGGYFHSDPYPRPTGRIPLIADPRTPGANVGGSAYPVDGPGPLGAAFQNTGTAQPKVDVRVDQEIANGRITYAGGVAGTEGTIYTGVGPFDIQSGSVMSYGKVSYTRGALRLAAFTNVLDAEAPNLLVPDARTGQPLRLGFQTTTIDVEASHAMAVGGRHALSYGGNVRRNLFDISISPASRNRSEVGAYVQDEIFLSRWRVVVGARLDKFGNIDDVVFSPRLSAIFTPRPAHAIRLSFNRAFRAPSSVNNYLDIALVNPVDLSAIGVPAPFPLTVRAIGSELPIGSSPQARLKEESLTAYEVAYTGALDARTTVGVAFYVNDMNDTINFVALPANFDPYTPADPPPGWPLPPAVLGQLAQVGIFLPRTAFTYLNLGPTRQRGLEVSLDHRWSAELSVFGNYSWQSDPDILDDPAPYPPSELSLPPRHRFNAGGAFNGARYVGSVSINYTARAFWSDVLTSSFAGFTEAFTLVNGSVGVKWPRQKLTTSLKVNNLLNETVQQHVFGDLIRRTITGEVRVDF
jgi:outer membrane receptor protein involved in Fe transport